MVFFRAFIGILLIAPFFAISLFGCDYGVQLPGGYELGRIYAGAVILSNHKGRVVIAANIDGFQVIEKLIVGHVTVPKEIPENEASSEGYFIVDTKSHLVIQGLDKTKWIESLRARGVNEDPRLSRP